MSQATNDDPVMGKVKKTLLSRSGVNALKSTVRIFRAMDTNDDNELSPQEFMDGLARLGVGLTKQEGNYLLRAMDRNNDGKVSVDEFIRCMLGGLSARRQKIVLRAYDKFDKNNDGRVTLTDLKGTFNATNNPKVLRGEKTEKEVMQEFLAGFDDVENPDGVVTKEEFLAYYNGLSASIAHDEYFEAMILKAWELDEPAKPRLDTTNRIWGPEGDPLELKNNLIETQTHSKTLGETKKVYDYEHMRRQPAPFTPNPSVTPDFITTNKRDYPPYNGETILKSDPTFIKKDVFSPTGNPIIDNVRKRIIQRANGEGFKGMSRSFRIMDKDKNSSLDKAELDKGMRRYGVPLTPLELDSVMHFCDRDQSGLISLTEFLRSVRGPMTEPSRINIVRIAYDRLDTNGNGRVSLQEVASKYDASKNPKVLDGSKTVDEVMRDFIGDWDKDGNDVISWEEWLEYYSDISCSIDNNQYFELMIRNVWHISGGSGVAANTSNRRVLAKFADGSQKVLEIKDDIGLRKDDIQGMKRRLEQQGHKGIVKLELTG